MIDASDTICYICCIIHKTEKQRHSKLFYKTNAQPVTLLPFFYSSVSYILTDKKSLMKFKHFNLKEAQSKLFSSPPKKKSFDRRNFLKTAGAGLGTLSIAPAMSSADKISNILTRPFIIEPTTGGFTVKRKGKTCWRFPAAHFEQGAATGIEKTEGGYKLEIRGMKLNGSSLAFDQKADIYRGLTSWRMSIQIPQFSVNQNIDFIDWLDNKVLIESDASANLAFGNNNGQHTVGIHGNVRFKMDRRWHIFFEGKDAVTLQYEGKTYSTSVAVLRNRGQVQQSFIMAPTRSLKITLPEFDSSPDFVSDLQFSDSHALRFSGNNPELNVLIWNDKGEKFHQSLWINRDEEGLSFQKTSGGKQHFTFNRFFFISEQNDTQQPAIYIAAANTPNQWFTNGVASFLISADNERPDLQAFGQGALIRSYRFAPRLTAFKPIIGNALTLPTLFHKPKTILIAHQDDETFLPPNLYATANDDNQTPQKKVRISNINRKETVKQEQTAPPPDTTKQRQRVNLDIFKRSETTKEIQDKELQKRPTKKQKTDRVNTDLIKNKTNDKGTISDKIVVDKEKIVINPEIKDEMLAPFGLKFKVLRPEDLLLLEFEFRNFEISRKKGTGNIVGLRNKKEKGLVIITIQPQHTLEEAFFESNNLPGNSDSNKSIVLPVKYLRAYRSRLVFEYPAGGSPFPLTINSLLDWSKFELRTHPRAWITLSKEDQKSRERTKLIGREFSIASPLINKKTFVELDRNVSPAYGIKLNRNNAKITDLINVEKIANPQSIFSKETAGLMVADRFPKNMAALRISSPEEVPEDNTCIEAPALMQMSPSQVGGFTHRIGLSPLPQKETLPPEPKSGKISTKYQVASDQLIAIQQTNLANNFINSLGSFSSGTFELWHTRLGVRLKDGSVTDELPHLRTLRALWAFDANTDYKDKPAVYKPFTASLDASDRHILVHTTSNFSIADFRPHSIPVNRLMLTPLGAYLDWHVFFDVPKGVDDFLNITEWQHLATLGRDHYVKVVKEGHLFPFGHRAALVKVTERKFKDIKNRPAVNMQHMYVVILQREFYYGRNLPTQKKDFLEFPFQCVEIYNNQTPNIDKPQKIDTGLNSHNFYINSGGQPFLFDLTLTDKDGEKHYCKLPLAFLENDIAREEGKARKIVDNYLKNSLYNNLRFAGENISFAESLIDGDTQYETREMTFGGVAFKSPGKGEICFRPTMQQALVILDAVTRLTGNNDPVKIKLVDDNNRGHVFASVENAVIDFAGGSDKAGGFLTPNMAITGLSRLNGTVGGDLKDAENMIFKAESIFKSIEKITSAKIFGVIELSKLFDVTGSDFGKSMEKFIDLVQKIQARINQLKDSLKIAEAMALEAEKAVANEFGKTKEQVEKEINKIRQELEKKKQSIFNDIKKEADNLRKALNDSVPRVPNLKSYMTDDAFHVEYKWQPDLGGKNKVIFPDILKVTMANPKNALQINSHLEKSLDVSKPPLFSFMASFNNFSIEIVDCIQVNFKALKFGGGTSGKKGMDVELEKLPMRFIGALSFINDINKYIPSSGFSGDGNGPYMELTTSGVKVGYTLALPNIELGICMLSNVALGAFVNLPFTGEAMTIGFYFCTRENPFMLTVSCFGGGGFIQLVTRLDGLQSLEAAFEFGAAISLNVGVASGGVSVMGGIYFKIAKVEKTIKDEVVSYNQADLTAYLRINGRLSILGLIHVSLEFYLELHAVIAKGRVQKLEGTATLKVKVEILFFSKTVAVTVRRTLAGSGGDPNFAQMISPDDWEQYCIAFAN